MRLTDDDTNFIIYIYILDLPYVTNVLQLNATEFKQVALLSSWAICMFHHAVGEEATMYGLTVDERAELGYKCKRLLDMGRVLFLKDNLGFKYAQLVYYTEKTNSPENCMLVATRAPCVVSVTAQQ